MEQIAYSSETLNENSNHNGVFDSVLFTQMPSFQPRRLWSRKNDALNRTKQSFQLFSSRFSQSKQDTCNHSSHLLKASSLPNHTTPVFSIKGGFVQDCGNRKMVICGKITRFAHGV